MSKGTVLVLSLGLVACAVAAEPAEELVFGKPEIVPAPVSLSFETNVAVRLDASCAWRVTCPDPAAADWLAGHVKRWFGCEIRVTQARERPSDVAEDEGYALEARPGSVSVRANGLAGVRHAAATLRQAAQCVPEGVTAAGYWLPALTVKDAPKLAFRALHVCWMPETPSVLVERLIRLAGYYKMNYVVLESWGVFRSERHPWWGWADGPLTKAELRRLRAVAEDCGVTLVPQLNIFGHAALSRGASGKHAVLDLAPEYQPLYEPDGWNWCLSNPAARQVIRDLVAEMHEAFGNPPYFHIGCDEAHAPGCARCRAAKPYATLVERNIREVNDLLRARGTRAMMWHDMLLDRADPQWKPFYANGSKEGAAMLARLPRDLVICEWYYGGNYGRESAPKDFQTLAYFQTNGFATVTCPWNDTQTTWLQGEYAAKHGLMGMLGTTWHHQYKDELPQYIVATQACAAWGVKPDSTGFARHWRQVGWDIGGKTYLDCGYVGEQIPSKTNVELQPGG